jgi:hypothetical protein
MRRFVISAALAGIASTSACAGGGSALNFSNAATPERTIVSAGGTNVPRVLAGAGIAVSAISVGGAQNGIVSNQRFIWHGIVTNDAAYTYDAAGHTRSCGAVTTTTNGTTAPYAPDMSIYIAIDPVNEANVIFSPPLALPAPPGSTIAVRYPYCVALAATPDNPAGPAGTLIVAVADPQNPLQ